MGRTQRRKRAIAAVVAGLVLLGGVVLVQLLGHSDHPRDVLAPSPGATEPGIATPGNKHKVRPHSGHFGAQRVRPSASASLPQGAAVTTSQGDPGGSTTSLARHRVTFRLVAERATSVNWAVFYTGVDGPAKDGGTSTITSWQRSVTTYGPTATAGIIVETGWNAVKVWCEIDIDGKQVVRKATKGPYSWASCHG